MSIPTNQQDSEHAFFHPPTSRIFTCCGYRTQVAVASLEEGSHPEKNKALRNTEAPLSTFLILLQMALMYTFTASTKNGETWNSGIAVYQTMHISHYTRQPAASILAMFPEICRIFTHATLYIEKYGWLLAFLPCQLARMMAFAMFCALHIGMYLTLRVGNFQLFVISGWCIALPGCFLDKMEMWLHHRWPRSVQVLLIQSSPKSEGMKLSRLMMNILGFTLIALCIAESQLALQGLVNDLGFSKILIELDLKQHYSMFSPNVPQGSLRVHVFGILASPKCHEGVEAYWNHCDVAELWTNGLPSFTADNDKLEKWPNITAPGRHKLDFVTNRWRKLVEKNESSRAIGPYICLKWQNNHHQTGGLLGLWFVRVFSKFPNPTEHFVEGYKHWCTPDAKSLMLKLPRQPWLDNDAKVHRKKQTKRRFGVYNKASGEADRFADTEIYVLISYTRT